MTAKPLRAGGEVDSWCTKCQLILNHRIVALDKDRPVKVECLTCRAVHMYRPHAPGQKPTKASKAASGSSSSTKASGSEAPAAGGRTTRASAAAARAEMAERDRIQSWEKAIAGRAMGEFRSYRINESYAEGDLVRHSRFGDGVVTRILDAQKIEVLFKDDMKTLAQNLTD